MNTHDEIELPPLPFVGGLSTPDYERAMHEWCYAAIEPYAKRIAELEAALQHQYRSGYEEGWKDALEWADRQRRGEPVAKVRDRGFEVVDGKHVPTVLVEFPVDDWESRDRFAASVDTPQPTEPMKCLDPSMGEHACSNRTQCWEPCGELGRSIEQAKVAEPVKVPSDANILHMWDSFVGDPNDKYPLSCADKLAFARALLARYGAESAEPVHQFRKKHCADWYDGHPDHSDGGGPYEVRTLYPAPVAAQPSVPGGWPTKEMVIAFAEVFSLSDQKGTFAPAFRAALAAAPTPPATEQAQQDADKADALLQLIDEFRERLPSSFLTLVDAARAGREE